MKSKQLIIVSLLLMTGCTTVKKVATVVPEAPKVSTETLTQGKDLYDNRCGKCHKLFAASDYSVKQWPKVLDSMQSKAKITDEQKAQIFAYLSAGAKQ